MATGNGSSLRPPRGTAIQRSPAITPEHTRTPSEALNSHNRYHQQDITLPGGRFAPRLPSGLLTRSAKTPLPPACNREIIMTTKTTRAGGNFDPKELLAALRAVKKGD